MVGIFPCIPPPFCRFLSESLTHIFAKFVFVTLPIGLQNWNHRFAVNLSHKAQICDSIDLFRRDPDPSALRLEAWFCKMISVVTSYKRRAMNASLGPCWTESGRF